MPIAPGARVGGYEVLALLGAGGMGEVYRARDTKLGRPVAIKVLLAAVALDTDRIARFEREAKLLAALNHPHIAALYGMEEAEGQQFLVMELVEGETLAERLARGAIPVEAALRMALQIADALEAAHEKGIIHRDLKPANIKITPDDRVKVLDFGLARAADVVEADAQIGRTHSPTLSLMATQAGLILGTAAYMSPEQAKGLQADHRSDVFSFGCVLYEMLTGTQAFQGDSVPDILASVLAREPDLRALPPSLNPRLTELVRRCLDKTPKRRYQATGDVRVELETIAKSPHADPAAPSGIDRRASAWRNLALYGVPALLLGASIAVLAMRLTARPTPPRVVRSTIAATGDAAVFRSNSDHDVTITPDGSRIVYVGSNGTRLFVRAIDELEPVAIASGRGLRGPFVSPDGQAVGFFDAEQHMMRVSISGGPAIPIVNRIDGTNSRGASWGRDDNILFATSISSTGLQRVNAGGGPVTVVTRADRTLGEADHVWPSLLPDGRAALFTITSQADPDALSVAVIDLATGKTKIVLRGGSDARYFSSGHLVYAASGTLRAVPFDLRTLETRGAPAPVLSRVAAGGGSADFAMSDDGTLVYIESVGDGGSLIPRKLFWVDRAGKEQEIPAPPRRYQNPAISPDGTRIAVAVEDQQRDIWIWDLRRAVLTRLTMDPNVDTFPVWTRDSSRIVYASGRDTSINLWWQPADGSGAPERLLTSPNIQIPTSITPDGRDLIFHEVKPETSADVLRMPLAGPHKPEPLIQTTSFERQAVLSRDGRWLAFESNSSGTEEIFVRSFAGGTPSQWQVSAMGGTRPSWGHDELFYIGGDNSLMRVAVPPNGTVWTGSAPTKLFDRFQPSGSAYNRNYDVAPDSQRFVIVKEIRSAEDASVSSITMIQHFDQEVTAHGPTK
jgi:eukaryotic-like serine/threonine-protein kinase